MPVRKKMNKRHHTGRHFLKSPAVARKMADAAAIMDYENVLEIGTGQCAITPLLSGKSVVTYETDLRMYGHAKTILKKHAHIKAVCGDGFKSLERFDVFVSSLPYSQSRRAVEWLMQRKFSRAVIMVQEEFAKKLESRSGKQRKAISVLAYSGFDIERISAVSKDNFDPPPAVESAILRLKQKRVIQQKTVKGINMIFSRRRKIVSNIPGFSKYDAGTRLDDLSCEQIMEAASHV